MNGSCAGFKRVGAADNNEGRKWNNLKYHNTKVEYEGHKFDSKKERDRYVHLQDMQRKGDITDLRLQVPFELVPKNDKYRKVSYTADFTYTKDGQEHVEDVKSPATAKDKVFLLKRKLFYARYGKDIEVFL